MEKKILVETSARHVHLSQADVQTLFGEGAELTFKKELSQPGQFQANERVSVVGPKKSIDNVAILGPCRSKTQVEISATDARSIGIDIVVRESGDTEKTPGCKLVGPKGEIEISEGVIVAKRHIHLTPEIAEQFELQNKEVVSVTIINDVRTTTFSDVVIRVSPTFAPAMHIDTDESNAAMVELGTHGIITKQ